MLILDDVKVYDSILSLKYKIYKKDDILPQQQRLIYRGYSLTDERLIIDCNINDNSTIHLITQLGIVK